MKDSDLTTYQSTSPAHYPGGEGEGVLPEEKKWVGVCDKLPETLTLFQTKIRGFPYPISDLIKNLILYFRPDP